MTLSSVLQGENCSLGLTEATDLWSLLSSTACSLLSADRRLPAHGGFKALRPQKARWKEECACAFQPFSGAKIGVCFPNAYHGWKHEHSFILIICGWIRTAVFTKATLLSNGRKNEAVTAVHMVKNVSCVFGDI